MTQLKHIDPDKMWLRRKVLVPLFNNPAGYWYLTKVAPRIDATLTPATHAWFSLAPGTPLLFMTHTGVKSGIRWTIPLLYWSCGDDVILMASNFGRDKHSGWLYNVRANPEVTLEFRGKRGQYSARVAEGAEHDLLWEKAKEFVANYRSYEQRAAESRNIEVVVCEPIPA